MEEIKNPNDVIIEVPLAVMRVKLPIKKPKEETPKG